MTRADQHKPDNRKPYEIAQGILNHIVTPAIKPAHEDDIDIPSFSFETAFKDEDSGTLLTGAALTRSKVNMSDWVAILRKIASRQELSNTEAIRFQQDILSDFAHYNNALFELRRHCEVLANPFDATRNGKEAEQAEHQKDILGNHLKHAKSQDELFHTMDVHITGFDQNHKQATMIADVITNFDSIAMEIRALAQAMKLELTEPSRHK